MVGTEIVTETKSVDSKLSRGHSLPVFSLTKLGWHLIQAEFIPNRGFVIRSWNT